MHRVPLVLHESYFYPSNIRRSVRQLYECTYNVICCALYNVQPPQFIDIDFSFQFRHFSSSSHLIVRRLLENVLK